LETLGRIGALNPEITRIILTGYATMEAAIKATNAGIDGFLTKPFDNIELRAKIRDIWVRKHLRQFVSETIYQEINKSPNSLAPRFHDVTILFSDIRNFTRMSQQLSPQELVNFLNDNYFSPMGEIAYEYEGTLDKHIGDSIMVIFGSPVPQSDDALRAVRAAIAMQEKAHEIDDRLRKTSTMRLNVGIGIATGKVFSGIMGSLRKKEFTSVGMAVNIAARLQALAHGG
jgi:adenylate cyclase